MIVIKISFLPRAVIVLLVVLIPAYLVFTHWDWQSLMAIQSQGGITPIVLIMTVSVFVAFIAGFWLIRGFDEFSLTRNRSGLKMSVEAEVPDAISQLARRYDYSIVRGDDNVENEQRQNIINKMREIALSSPYDPTPLRDSPSAGRRLAALIMMQVQPDFDCVDWLAKQVTKEKKFLGAQAALAILSAAKLSDSSQQFSISKAIDHLVASNSPVFDRTDDRRSILEQVEKEIWERD